METGADPAPSHVAACQGRLVAGRGAGAGERRRGACAEDGAGLSRYAAARAGADVRAPLRAAAAAIRGAAGATVGRDRARCRTSPWLKRSTWRWRAPWKRTTA